mgnify:CR=1 FL=1
MTARVSLTTSPAPAPDGSCPALAVHELSAGYRDAPHAVENVTFAVGHGERVGVVGPNGAGKSTLFKAIAGLIPHHTGYISLCGEDCATSHTLIGYVPQQDAIDWSFPVTVRDVVMMGRVRQIGWLRFPSRRDWETVDALLARVGMLDCRHRQIGQLSGGQRRRVFIARALAQQTDVLLLDEPFSGVDAAAEEEILATLDLLRAEGVTVILATHDMRLAASRFDKLLLLNRRVIAFGAADQVFRPELLEQAYGGRIGIFHEGERTLFIVDDHGGPDGG